MGRTRSQTRSALAAARLARGATRSTPTRAAKKKTQEEVVVDSGSEYEESEEEEELEEEQEEEGDDEADAVAEYERKRLANIQRNLEFMQSMGVSTVCRAVLPYSTRHT